MIPTLPGIINSHHLRGSALSPIRPDCSLDFCHSGVVGGIAFRSDTRGPNGRYVRACSRQIGEGTFLDEMDERTEHGKDRIIHVTQGEGGDQNEGLGCQSRRLESVVEAYGKEILAVPHATHRRGMWSSLAYAIPQEAKGEDASAITAEWSATMLGDRERLRDEPLRAPKTSCAGSQAGDSLFHRYRRRAVIEAQRSVNLERKVCELSFAHDPAGGGVPQALLPVSLSAQWLIGPDDCEDTPGWQHEG